VTTRNFTDNGIYMKTEKDKRRRKQVNGKDSKISDKKYDL
jgi:hypothetical protein